MIWSDFEFVFHLACIIKTHILDIIWPCLLIIMIMTWLFSGILFICARVVSREGRKWHYKAANKQYSLKKSCYSLINPIHTGLFCSCDRESGGRGDLEVPFIFSKAFIIRSHRILIISNFGLHYEVINKGHRQYLNFLQRRRKAKWYF